ncbi:3-oxoacyl-[acyl-carrier-protein] synthase-3 [Monaibacterium marinum]|uniref:Beta-ketoacyl-[acyl-carrier-protein] synthase III n=1 Tax=Pontivivens marinum TaxID=1690039 RepID=A0A2C9CLI5_9RHOB|nr:beta-ketoacyl-ACP synthase III [Monaibacterium marinum]SOH92371.1 3-oxoacyl-[acyl-carrier-protein] synthase-3 [Monaibacterium marinum]
MTTLRAVPVGCGHYLPDRIVPNSEFEKTLDTSDEWIRARTGIERRHFAADDQKTSDLAIAAAKAALLDAGLDGSDIDAIVLATATPDQTFPSTATRVQHAIGAGGFAFDMQAVCAGFIYALANADALIKAGQAKRVMVIGAETFSRILDYTDRGTCVLFGDGAGALILEAREGDGSSDDAGILSTDLHSDGKFNDLLYVDGGVSTTGTVGQLRMQGREVFKHAVTKLSAAGNTAMEKAGVAPDDVTYVVPHQANLRIITAVAQKMSLPIERIVVTVQDHGNTSAASIPLAMSVARADGRIKANDLILMEAIGGGLAWGAALMRW